LFNPNGQWSGLAISINSVSYTINSVGSTTSMTLTTSAGTQSGVPYGVLNAPAAIYSDNAGTALANPFTANTSGFYFFHADDYNYEVQLSGGGIVTPFTHGATAVIDPFFDPPATGWSGAIANRVKNSKLADTHSVNDFGAPCNGSSDNTAAYNLMLGNMTSTGNMILLGCEGPVTQSSLVTPYQGRASNYTSSEATFSPGLSIQTATHDRYLWNPDLYLSRYDTTDRSQCPSGGILGPCSAPIFRIDMTNPNTSQGMSDQMGILVNGTGYQSSDGVGYPVYGLGIALYDKKPSGAPLTNVTEGLQGANINVGWNNPTNVLLNSGYTRTVNGLEVDIENDSGADAVWNQNAGVYSIGESIIGAGSHRHTVALSINGTPTALWRLGELITNTYEQGLWITTNDLVDPIAGLRVTTPGAYGIIVGGGSTESLFTHFAGDIIASPTIGILLDSRGYAGLNTNPSNIVTFRMQQVVGGAQEMDDWSIQHWVNGWLKFSWSIQGGTPTDICWLDKDWGLEVSKMLTIGFSGSIGAPFIRINPGTPSIARQWIFPDADGTFADANYTPEVHDSSGNPVSGAKINIAFVVMSSGSATYTFPGAGAFTSSTSYDCGGSNKVSVNPFKVVNISGSQITVTGTGSDAIYLVCVGT